MAKRLYITPPLLHRWEPKGNRSDVISMDLEPDFLDDKTLRIDLNVMFRPISLTRRGWATTKDYYVGSTGARVVFETFNGKVKKYTPPATLKVNYENTYTRERSAAVKLSPKVEIQGGVQVDLGEVGFDRNVESSFATKFEGMERTLAVVNSEDGVEWELILSEKQALRDYLIGNLYLYVECSWARGRKEGTIELRASDVLFFDSHHRVIDGMRAILMRFVLYRQGKQLSRNKLAIRFEEKS